MPILDMAVSSFAWLIPICLIGAALYTWLLYGKRRKDDVAAPSIFASVLRFFTVFTLLFLLLSPIVRRMVRSYKKPVIVLAIDNSASVKLLAGDAVLKDFTRKTDDFIKSLEKRGFDVKITTFDQQKYTSASAVPFRAGTTDLDRLAERSTAPYKQANLAALILISDGNFNRGLSPSSGDYGAKVFTIGLGSETPKPDVSLGNIRYNSVVYAGNRFPLTTEIRANGFKETALEVALKEKDKILERKTIIPTSDRFMDQIEFMNSSSEKGFKHYTIEVQSRTGEFTLENNRVDALIQITDAKKRILIAGAVPHPDIKAIRSALEGKTDYEIISFTTTEGGEPSGPFDVVILHGMPHRQGLGNNLLKKYGSGVVPVWLITGADPALQELKSAGGDLIVSAEPSSSPPYGTLVYDKTFGAFDLSEQEQAFLNDAPDFYIPRADLKFKNTSDVLLSIRKAGSAAPTPIFIRSESESSKFFLTLGEGFWKWRLQEFRATEKHTAVDGLINRIVRYLSEDRRSKKFDVYLPRTEWEEGETLEAEVSVYTENSEQATKQDIEFAVEDEQGKTLRFTRPSSDAAQFLVPNLPAGIYRYTASAVINGKRAQESGMFIVRRNYAEATESAADYALLKETAVRSGGQFVQAEKLESLLNLPEFQEARTQIAAREELTEPVNIAWIFLLALALVSSEWLLRRYRGID